VFKARQKYNFSFKLRVIKFAEEKGKHAAAKFFNVDRKRCRNEVSRRSRMSRLIYIRDNLE
jgi:hypothetical protein